MKGLRCDNCLDFQPFRTPEAGSLFAYWKSSGAPLIPAGWVTIYADGEHHFCGYACLIAFADERNKSADIGVRLD